MPPHLTRPAKWLPGRPQQLVFRCSFSSLHDNFKFKESLIGQIDQS
jgi:hypothetical protein